MNFIIALFMVLMVGCNSADVQEAIEASSVDREKNQIEIPTTVSEGEYKSNTCEPDGRRGHKSYKLKIFNSAAVVTVLYHINSDCSDVGYDRTYSYYSINGEDLQYIKTDYTDMIDDAYQACGLTDLTLGLAYDIDDVGCELSLEGVEVKIIDNGDKTLKLLDKTFR